MTKSITQFIGTHPENVRRILRRVRATITKKVPGVTQTIAYGIPTFQLNSKNLVHFSAFAKHIGFYPTPSGIVKFKKQLAPFKTAKGSVQFPLNQPIPYGLIGQIAAWRAKQVKNEYK